MANYDLTPRIAPNLDRHLVFPLLEFLQERHLYENDQILKAKIELLNKTNMVDYAIDIHKSLYHTEDVPQDMVERRVEVVARLKALEEAAAPLVAFLQNPSAVQDLKADKQYNLQMLNDRYQIGPDQIEALYQYAKFQFECGNYYGAADYLYQYRALCTNSERSLSALWGKLAAEILMQNWDIALEELNRLKEIIDSKSFTSPMNQVQSRIWLMHWSLFIFFNHDNGRTQIIDLFNQDKYQNAIQTSAPHLLRYLATAFIINKRRRPQFKDFIKVIQQEQHSYKDPVTEFLACVYVNYDFDGAQQKMRECEEVILNDPFLAKQVEEGNFSTVPLRDEFLENARLFIFETYCRIHQRIDMGVLAEKLNLNYEEVWGCSSREDSDDEVFSQNTSDEEEHHFSSGSMPKLQFRFVKSKASWNDEMGMGEVIEKKGKLWVTTGIVRSGGTYSSIEETLYLMELGALHLMDNCETGISLADIYRKIAGRKGGSCWELFEVYRHLKSLGYVVGRHGVAWSLKGTKSAHKPIALEGPEEGKQSVDMDSKDEQFINELFSEMQINELKLDFDVYLPNNRFRKSSPGDPSFLLHLSRGHPPSRAEIEVLERQCSGIPLKISLVEDGRVSFFSFDKVELPVLP